MVSDWIDVTRPLKNGMVHWPGDCGFCWSQVAMIEDGGVAISEIHASVHVGTHIDAPAHFVKGGASVEQLCLGALCGPALVIEVVEPRDVTVADLTRAAIQQEDRVLFKTANEQLWAGSEFEAGYFGLTGDAAAWLVARRVRLVGIDYLSIDRFDDPAKPAHHILLGAGVALVEGLDLSAVHPGRYELVALPLKIVGSEGSPARVLLRSVSESPGHE